MTQFNPNYYPYPSQRMAIYARNGMVATSQPLAADAGLEIMKKGGNAIDAAIATAACLVVVEPTTNGIGGDSYALVWVKDQIYGLNASGPAPNALTIEAVKERGHEEIPTFGWIPVTVPGTPASWAALSERFGKLPFEEVLQPAINYAEQGYPISPTLGKYWKRAFNRFKDVLSEADFKVWCDLFAPGGRPPAVGEMWRSPEMAETLRSIAATKAESFYRGELADKIDAYSRANDGLIRKEDLAAYYPKWVDPISVNYRGYDIWEIPPNGQGIIALQALNILKGFDFTHNESVDTYHKQFEAMKLAFADGFKYITQEDQMKVTVKDLLSEEYAEERRKLIGEEAIQPEPGTPPSSGTIYLCTADGEGNMVSFIQSNYMGFGSGIVVPGTGIGLQNRGRDFSLDPEHCNCLVPGKLSYHTIIPGFMSKDGKAVGPFGVMGGFMQPQGHVQVVMNMVDFHLNPQAALDAPRWQWTKDKTVQIEPHFPQQAALALAERGHNVQRTLDCGGFGRGQIIVRAENGVLIGGTDFRTDSQIAAW